MNRKKLKNIFLFLLTLAALAALPAGCKQQETVCTVPQSLQGKVFVYDQLESGEGDALYTLGFDEKSYFLYQNGGTGVLSSGCVRETDDGTLIFSEAAEQFTGRYTGGAFREPTMTLQFGSKEVRMVPASETAEDVYQSYLGVYEGSLDKQPAQLILERWKEFYLYRSGELIRGSYEIYNGKTLQLLPYEGKAMELSVTVSQDQDFETADAVFRMPGGELQFAKPRDLYEAAHAMGTYTLSVYGQNVFTIRGVDGFLKAFGVLDETEAVYFPRKMTGETEREKQFRIPFEMQQDQLSFPDTTPLLPRSGNINEQTGLGQYWNAGTKLEFIRKQEDKDLSQGIQFAAHTRTDGVSGGNFPASVRGLEPSMPSVGTARPLVLLVDFPDFHRPRHVSAEGMEKALFSLEDPNSLASFYYRSSYGNLIIDGTVLDWYRTRHDRDSYQSDKELMAEVIDHYIDEGVRLADFDSDGDGAIDSLYVLWAGNLSGQDGIWNAAYRSGWDSSPEEWERAVSGYIFVPGSTVWSLVPPLKCNTNSLIHESGHLLGLNDYYSYDTSPRSGYTGGALEGGLAGMDMMDANIGDHNIFSKWLLGWVDPQIIEYEDLAQLDGRTVRLRPSGLAPDGVFIKLKASDSLYTELLVIEAVAPVGNASEYTRLTQPVVRVLHVDASEERPGEQENWRGYGFRCDNSYTTTKFISALEADGEDSFLNYLPASGGVKPSYSEQDYFHAGDRIGPDTYPNTNGYDAYGNAAVSTGLVIEIEKIEPDGTAQLRLSFEEPGDCLQIVSVSPDPRIVPSENPAKVPEGTKELVFTFDREIASEELNRIQVCADQKILDGTAARIEENRLIVTLPQGLQPEESVTVVIPHGIIHWVEDPSVIFNSNAIYGFAA